MALTEGISPERRVRRRSLRIVMRVPLYICPADSPATAEWEPVETLVISMHGGMIRTRRRYPVGTMLDIRMRNQQRFTRGRVVWSGTGAKDIPYELGFEIMDQPGFWDVKFPADRPVEGKTPPSNGTNPTAKSSPAAQDNPKLVCDIMTTDLTTLREDEMLLDATLIFARGNSRHIPIMSGQRLVGIVTERDLKHYTPSILSGISPEEYNRLMATTPLAKIMIRNPITIAPGKSIYEAARALYDSRIGCLPVVENGVLKGIVTTTDMLNLLLHLLKDKGLAPPELGT